MVGRALVNDLRDPASPIGPPPGIRVLVGGGAAEVVDVVDQIGADFPRTALFILVTTYLILLLLLRSVVLPAKALVMNTLSILASFGALVWIFQDGNLSGPLGFVPPAHAAPGTRLQTLVRGKPQAAEVTATPFVPHRYVRKPSK